MTVEVLNFGCRLNLAEGERIRALAAGQAATTIINSCAVTNEAVRQARQAARRARRARPDERVLVTGCAAHLDPASFAAMPEVSAVLDNRAKLDPASYGGDAAPPARTPVVSGANHARAFVEVQTGCDHSCTFCIIPQARGPSQSFPEAEILAAARAAVERGQQEVVLTGVDVTSYHGSLGALVSAILGAVPALPRLRLSSLDPMEVDPLLFDLLANEPRVMPHLHLSLQAGDDLILKRMKRRHLRAHAIALVARLKARRPAIAIGADLIAGFPTETEAMFDNSLKILEDCDIVLPHIFPFSPRHGTPAARMPLVPPPVVRERAARLREAARARQQRWLSGLLGTRQTMLVERDGRTGHAENFAKVVLDQPAQPHTLLPVQITGQRDGALVGVPA